MIHLGDITKIDGKTAPTVDVIIGGSPCQDLSVAGKRAGLKGRRSGLFTEQIRIVKEMREASEKSGTDEIRPRYMVWENVPGAFSSNAGEDFRAVLEETMRIVDERAVIPRPAGGKWRTCGCIMGDKFSVAWRVFDAQFWGVPQRRRRIALIADFGGGTAPEILFERKSMSGSIEESGETGKRAADAASGNVGVAIGFNYRAGSKAGGIGAEREIGGTLKSGCDDAAVCYSLNLLQDPVPNREKATSLVTGNGRIGQASLGVCYREADFAAYEKGIGTLKASGGCLGGGSETLTVKNYKVRRLTPLECERLQGFPDGWTDIGEWTDAKGKARQTTDGARYKALGNSIALPPWEWVLKRLSTNYERAATLASLFDGIGGFPLIWERLNGRGSCLWTSEIEEFPIAVTKKRFG